MSTMTITEADLMLEKTPTELFSGTPDEVGRQFKKLALRWHPDVCRDPLAQRVFDHLRRCRDAALGEETPNRLVFHRRAGAAINLDFIHRRESEFGPIFTSASNFTYLVPQELEDLIQRAISVRWRYPNRKIEAEISKHLPRSTHDEKGREGHLLAYRRDRSHVLLADLLEFERQRGGKIDHRSVMWFISSLLNLCCYLEVSQTAHCGLVAEFISLDLQDHSVNLVGPPMFACKFGSRPDAAPSEVLAAFPRLRVKSFKVENSLVDLTMLRRLALRMLGYASVSDVRRDNKIPAGLRDWLCSPPPTSAVTDYCGWEKNRGKRAFHEYGVTARQIYQALGT